MSAPTDHYDADAVRAASDIVALARDYLVLKPSGSTGRQFGLCPFHREKTPSFSVNGSRQRFNCFGCGARGDVFDFLMRIEGISFQDALRRLADSAGIVPIQWTAQQRRTFAAASAAAPAIGQSIEDFARGLTIAADYSSRIASELLCLDLDLKVFPSYSEAPRLRRVLRNASTRDIAELWKWTRTYTPIAFNEITARGREDRLHAAEITEAIVQMLAAAPLSEARAA